MCLAYRTCYEDKQGKGTERALFKEGRQGCFLITFDHGLEEGEGEVLLSIWGKINTDNETASVKPLRTFAASENSPVRLECTGEAERQPGAGSGGPPGSQ